MSPVLVDRMRQVMASSFGEGKHEDFEHGMCVMEAASYIANEPWSDHPKCVCPVLGAFMRAWNDGLPTDEDRDRFLKPLIESLIDTKSTTAVEERRSYLALDWLIRVFTPKWLDLVPSLRTHAQSLRDLAEISDLAGAVAAGEITHAAWDAAWVAARAAASDAARDAAWDAAWDAARVAARDAAWDAAWVAAWVAARDAAWDASAVDLVRRMIAVKP